jgi:hypothetical protein
MSLHHQMLQLILSDEKPWQLEYISRNNQNSYLLVTGMSLIYSHRLSYFFNLVVFEFLDFWFLPHKDIHQSLHQPLDILILNLIMQPSNYDIHPILPHRLPSSECRRQQQQRFQVRTYYRIRFFSFVRLGKELQFSGEMLRVFVGEFFGCAKWEEQVWKQIDLVRG